MIRYCFLLLSLGISLYASSVPKLQVGNQWIGEAKYTPDHKLIVVISGTKLEFWQAETMRLLHREVISHTNGAKVLISPDSKEAYIVIEGVVKIYDLNTLQLKSGHKAFEGVVADIAIYTSDKKNILIYSHWNSKNLIYRFDLVTKVTQIDDSSATEKCIFIDDTADRVDKEKLNLQVPWTDFLFGAHNGKVIFVDDNRYIGWDLNEGKEIWRNITHTTICKDCEPHPKVALYHHSDFAIVSPSNDFWSGFDNKWDTQGLLRFDLKSGIYEVLPFKYNGTLQVSVDDKTLKIINYKDETKEFDLTTLKNQETAQHYIDDIFDSLNESMKVEQLFDGTYGVFNKTDNSKIASFVSFKDGEWLLVTTEGYFNASSKKVLNHLNIYESLLKARALNDGEVVKYYRPDIVSSLLQGKSIEKLESNTVLYSLADQAKFENTYNKSLEYSFKKTNRLAFLINMEGYQDNFEYANITMKEIVSNKNLDDLTYLYKVLSRFNTNLTRDFLVQRIDQKISEDEQTEIVKILAKDSVGIEKIVQLYNSGKLADWTKRKLPTFLTAVGYERFEALLWENLDFNMYDEKQVLAYLQKKDPKRLQILMDELFEKECSGGITKGRCELYVMEYYDMNPEKVISFLKNDLDPTKKSRIPFLYRRLQDSRLVEPLLNRLFIDNKMDMTVYNILMNYKSNDVKKLMIKKIKNETCSNLGSYQQERIYEDFGIVRISLKDN